MTRPLFLLMSGMISLLLLGGFQCEPYCDTVFELRDWRSAWINNSGSEPLVTTDPIPRAALGIRLSATLLNLDSLAVAENEDCTWQAIHPISQLEVLLQMLSNSVAIGENISSRFRFRSLNASSFEYLTLGDALGFINFFYSRVAPDYKLDLLMTEPPSQAGSYRFTVKIEFDSIFMPPIRDTFFTPPHRYFTMKITWIAFVSAMVITPMLRAQKDSIPTKPTPTWAAGMYGSIRRVMAFLRIPSKMFRWWAPPCRQVVWLWAWTQELFLETGLVYARS